MPRESDNLAFQPGVSARSHRQSLVPRAATLMPAQHCERKLRKPFPGPRGVIRSGDSVRKSSSSSYSCSCSIAHFEDEDE